MHYYQHNIADYRKDTAHLSLLEHGVYRQLLDWFYLDETPIPEITETVYRRLSARTDAEKEAVLSVLNDFFFVKNGYVQRRAQREIDAYNKKADQAREAGKLGGRPLKTVTVISVNQEQSDRKANSLTNEPNNSLTKNQEPRTKNQEPETKCSIPSTPLPLAVAPASKKPRPKENEPSVNKQAWQAYGAAYEERYGVAPIQNGTVNAQMANFVKRVGAQEAPEVARWYVGHQNRFYVEVGHSVGMLMRDCEKLRTEWATGRQVTSTQAMQADKTQTNFNVFDKLIAEERAKGQAHV